MSWTIFSLLSGAFEGGLLVSEKKGLHHEHAMEFTAAASIVALAMSIPLWLFAKTEQITLVQTGLVFCSALLASFGLLWTAKGLRHISIKLATPHLSLTPIIATLAGIALLSESYTSMQVLGIAIASGSMFLLESHGHASIFEPFKHIKRRFSSYILFGTAALVLSMVIDKIILSRLSLTSFLAMFFFFLALDFVVMMLLFHDGFDGIRNGLMSNTKMLIVFAILLVASKASLSYALVAAASSVGLAGTLRASSVLFSNVFDGDFFEEGEMGRKSLLTLIAILGFALAMRWL